MNSTQPQNPVPFFVTIPHSGEKVPEECSWLKALPEEILMCDVDRFVYRLNETDLGMLKNSSIKTEWHRYAADLNRIPEDVDAASVQEHLNAAGLHNRGFHWQITTKKQALMKSPMPLELHEKLIKLIYEPFHESIRNQYRMFNSSSLKSVFQLDAHSMPSLGTSEHRDPGQQRAEIVVSDCKGLSSCPQFVDLVIAAYAKAGFKVGYNWPYFGGRVSEQYGDPKRGQHVVQVEMNRALYMNEETKKLLPDSSAIQQIQEKLQKALAYIQDHLILGLN